MPGKTRVCVGRRTLLAKTCNVCGELKQACEYRKIVKQGHEYYRSDCSKCTHNSAKVADKTGNHASWDTATNTNSPWTTGEINLLIDLLRQGFTHREIATKMGRSLVAVRTAKHRYGLGVENQRR